jgi:hypothetical protein
MLELTRVLKNGVNGADVLELERALLARGYLQTGAPDVVFGDNTQGAVATFQQTHLGRDGKPLAVDGWVGPETWWALHSRDIDQRSGLGYRYTIPAGIGAQRKEILEVALAEHRAGVREDPMGSNRGPRVDLYTGYAGVPARDAGPKWCSFFVSWALHSAMGVYPLGQRVGSCLKSRELARSYGRWFEADDPAGVIVPGDVFVMLYRADNGALKGTGHTGLVAAVSPDARHFNTLEGNCGNRVKLGFRARSTMAGFWHPCDVGTLPTGFETRVFELGASAAREATA